MSHSLPTCECGAPAPLLVNEPDGEQTPVCIPHYTEHSTTPSDVAQALAVRALLDDVPTQNGARA